MAVRRAALFHDLCGFGRCSLTSILPVLSVMRVQCCPAPTAVLSTHTGGFPQVRMTDLTRQMEEAVSHWEELELTFDAVYSGFLMASSQAGAVLRCMEHLAAPDAVLLVDPVLGDNGSLYRTCTPRLCGAMRELADRATLITPNFTEAAFLLEEPYDARPRTAEGVADWLRRLSGGGKRSVVLTGLELREGMTGAASLDRNTGKISLAETGLVPAPVHGTGDLFGAVLLGALLRGDALADACLLACRFCRDCVAAYAQAGTPRREGVPFEPLLGRLL